MTVISHLKKTVMFFCSSVCKRMKPVSKMCSTILKRPCLESNSYLFGFLPRSDLPTSIARFKTLKASLKDSAPSYAYRTHWNQNTLIHPLREFHFNRFSLETSLSALNLKSAIFLKICCKNMLFQIYPVFYEVFYIYCTFSAHTPVLTGSKPILC